MKTNDLKKQLAAVMAVALTFSSVPVVSADNSLISEGDSAIVEELAANPIISASGATIAQDGVIYVVEGDGTGTFTLSDTVVANTTTWTSSNPDIVSIGEATGVATIEKDAIGEVTITATNGSQQSSTIKVVVLDEIGYSFSVGANATAEEKSGGLAVEVADTSNTNLIKDAINGLITAGKLKLDFTGKSDSTRAITADDYTIAISEINGDGKVTVTVSALSADAAKIFSLTGVSTSINIKVDQAKTKVTPVIPTGATVDVAVFESDNASAREGKVVAAITNAIKDNKFQLVSGSTKLETELVSADPKGDPSDTARTTYTVVAKVPDASAGKYSFEGGYNNATGATGDVTINYVASKAKVDPNVGLAGVSGTKGTPVSVSVPKSATTSEENDIIATAVKSALDVSVSAEDSAALTVDKDYSITVSKKETGIYTATFTLLNDKYQINPDTAASKYSVDVYVNVTKTATTLTTFTAALSDSNSQTVSVKKGATLAEKEAAAIKQIEEKLVITAKDSSTNAVSLTKGTDYSVEIKATNDDKTAFTVTVKLINKTDYTVAKDPDVINVTVTYSEQAEIVEIKTITPVIGGVESGKGTKYPVNILATDGDSAKTAKAQKALEEVLTLSGVDGLVKGTDYTYEITIDSAKDTATATFTLVSAKYKIDSSVSKNNVVTKTVDVNFVVAAEEVSPKLALKDKASAEKTFYVSENASVESLKERCTDYVTNGGWTSAVSGGTAYEVKDAGKLKVGTDYTIKNDAYVYNSKNNTATVTVSLTLKNTTDYALASDAVTELVFNFKFVAKKEIKVSDPNITCASPLSCDTTVKKSAFAGAKVKAAVEKQLTDAGLTINTAEAAGDFEVSVAASTYVNDGTKTAATATIKLLDGDKYAIAGATSGPKAVPNSTAVTYTLTCNYTNNPLTAKTKITPVVTAPKSVEVEVLPTDDDAARSKKAIEQITSETTYVVYGADRSDITSTLVKDTDYTFSVVDNKTLSPSATVTFAIKNAADYVSADIAEDTGNKKPAIKASLTANVKITYVEKETNTDKWVKAEDGTYSYTISYASTEENPVKDGTLKLDLGDADLEKVSNITAVLTVTGEGAYAGGCLGATDAAKDAAESGKGWVTANWSSEDADKNGDITVSLDVDGVTEDSAELQLWWAGKDTTVTLKEVKVSTEEAATKPEITKIFGDVNRVGINWSEVKGATGYGVFVKANGKWSRYCMTGKDTLGKYVKDLKPGTKYAFAVKAYVDGKWTDIASEDIKTATPLGAVPVITKAKALTGKVGLNWAETKNATGYAVWVKDGKTWTRFCMTGKAARGKYVTGLKAGSKYAIAVKAYVDGKWTDVTSDTYVTVTAK